MPKPKVRDQRAPKIATVKLARKPHDKNWQPQGSGWDPRRVPHYA